MSAVVEPTSSFIRDVNERVAWLAQHRDADQLHRFVAGLEEVRRRIEDSPEAGATVRSSATNVIRMRLCTPPLPYLVYYAHPRSRPVRRAFLLRLYASGQRREETDLSEWPWE